MQDHLLPQWSVPPAVLLSDQVILDSVLEASDAPTCIIDPGLRFVRFNRAAAEAAMVRWGRVLRPGIALTEVLPEGAYLDSMIETVRAALAGTPQCRRTWMDGVSGKRSLQELRHLPIRGEDGRVVGDAVIAREVQVPSKDPGVGGTELLDFRHVFDAAPLGMAITRRDGTILQVNEAFGKLLGTIPSKLVGRTIRDITYPDDRGRSPVVALVRGNLARYDVEKRYLRDDGNTVSVKVTAIRLEGEERHILGVAEELRSGTIDPTAERERDRRWKTIFEAQPAGVALLSHDGLVVDANPAFIAMQGGDTGLSPGLHVSEFDVGQCREALLETLTHARRVPVHFETIHRRRDGSTFPVNVTAGPMVIDGEPHLCYTQVDISDQRRHDAARILAEAKYRVLVESSPNVTYTWSSTRGGLFYSPQVERMLGYTPAELVEHPFRWLEAIHPEDRDRNDATLSRMEAEGGFDLELRIRHKDGSWRWIREWSASVGRIADELIVVGQAIDMTPLRTKEAQFERLVEGAPDILYRWIPGPIPHFDYISAAVTRILGFTPAELCGDPMILAHRVHPDDLSLAMAYADAGSVTDAPLRVRALHRDGHTVWLELRRTLIRDEDGIVIAMEGIARDISEEVATEHRLQMMGSALEQAAEVAIVTDRGGMITQVNTAFERVTGYSRAEAIGKNPNLLKSGKQSAEFYARMWETLTAGEIWRGTVSNRCKDGRLYTAEEVITPIRAQGGEIVSYIGLQHDVTRERLLDESLRQAQKMEAVGQVTGGVAHDFNNMLTVILANANLIESELAPGSEGQTWLTELISAAQHGSGMVRQLLAFGRREHLNPVPLRLADEFGAFIPVLRRVLCENIELSLSGADNAWALVDRTAFEQMILNLATNARDAMPNGGHLRVRIAGREISTDQSYQSAGTLRPGRYATISVQDSGAGIDAATLKRVFEPFFTTKPVGKGTGLGLPMVHGLMQQHQGWVDIQSTVGMGTTVTLGFPVTEAPIIREAASGPASAAVTAGRGELILVVEDEDSLRRVTTRTLEREGFKILTAADGEAGWAQWNEHGDAIALILTDAVMPRLGGVDLIRRLRITGASVPVILMSGYSAEDLSDPTLQGVPVVAKPWSGAVLAQRIRETLDACVDV